MCIICISESGVSQPTEKQIRTMFERNPHGAGYMYARDGVVTIHKGFMDCDEFLKQIRRESFTDSDAVIYHFRISTQGGVNREMCHPFALSKNIEDMKHLDVQAKIGIVHNGIIPLTTNRRDTEYSDTAHFIAEYLPALIRKVSDIKDPMVLDIIGELIQSKMAFLDGMGFVSIVGDFIREDNGLIFSNSTYKERPQYAFYNGKPKAYRPKVNYN